MADGVKYLPIILTGLLTGGISSGSTYWLQREQFRQEFQGSLIADNLNEFVGACVTDNPEQRTFFMIGVAEALECSGGEVQHCVIRHVRENCGRFVSPAELEAVEADASTDAALTDEAAPAPPAAAAIEAPAAEAEPGPLRSAAPSPAPLGADAPATATPRARLFMHVASDTQRTQLRPVNDALRASSLTGDVAVMRGIEIVEGFNGATHVRYFFPEDRDEAVTVIQALQARLPSIAPEPRLIGGYANRRDRLSGQIELWVSPTAEVLAP